MWNLIDISCTWDNNSANGLFLYACQWCSFVLRLIDISCINRYKYSNKVHATFLYAYWGFSFMWSLIDISCTWDNKSANGLFLYACQWCSFVLRLIDISCINFISCAWDNKSGTNHVMTPLPNGYPYNFWISTQNHILYNMMTYHVKSQTSFSDESKFTFRTATCKLGWPNMWFPRHLSMIQLNSQM